MPLFDVLTIFTFFSDMMDLPDELYQCLKNITSQEPSPKTLESYLPSIRDIILKLLQGLKMKQKTLRERFEPSQKSPSPLKERFDPPPPRTSSPLKEVPSPLNLKLPYQKRISVPQTPISPLSSLEHHTQTDKQGKSFLMASNSCVIHMIY